MPTTQTQQTGLREIITKHVRHLMVERGEDFGDLAPLLRVTPRYLKEKMRDQRWTLDDLDALAAHYSITPADLVTGYRTPLDRQARKD